MREAARLHSYLGIRPLRPTEVVKLGMPSLLTCDMRQAASYFEVARDVIAQRRRKPAGSKALFGVEEELHAA